MNDTEWSAAWSTLEPSATRRRRIEQQVTEWLEARETSLLAEWVGFLRVEPLTGLAYAAVGAASLALLTPIGWMLAWLVS